jgi:hypothetical protein
LRIVEDANARDFRRLLRPRSERPRHCRAAEQRDELAPFHSITSSARASSVAGTVRPSDLAVLRLITSSSHYVDGAMDYSNPGDNIRSLSLNVRYREQPGQHMLVLGITGFDPVKELFVCAKHAAKKHFSRRAISLPISNQAARSPSEATYAVAAFHQGLKEGGYVEGQNVAIEYRWAEGQYAWAIIPTSTQAPLLISTPRWAIFSSGWASEQRRKALGRSPLSVGIGYLR